MGKPIRSKNGISKYAVKLENGIKILTINSPQSAYCLFYTLTNKFKIKNLLKIIIK